jgi:hypothetical protein
MNERIKQLAEQAYEQKPLMVLNPETFEIEHKIGNGGVAMYNRVFNQEKFAELIVAECLRQVEEQYKPVLEDEIMMKDTHWDGYVQCGVDSYVAIREHFFGVDQ